jgi:hypothetical protein
VGLQGRREIGSRNAMLRGPFVVLCVLCVSKPGADLKNPGQTARVSFVFVVRFSVGADLQIRDIADGCFQRIVKGVLGPDPQWGEEIPEDLANFAP